MDVLKAMNLTKEYGGKNGSTITTALNNFNISINSGDFTCIMGPSGSGKTTLLNILATIDEPTSGGVIINGTSVADLNEKDKSLFRRKKLGFIFQDFNLLNSLTIKENIILPLVLDKFKVDTIENKINDISSVLNIQNILNKKPYEVSGGQQQRAACARAIIHDPAIILADEPTGNLDSKASMDVMTSLTNLNEEKGATIAMVTHDPFAASFSKRVIMIKDGKFFLEIAHSGDRQVFFKKILDSLSLLGTGVTKIL